MNWIKITHQDLEISLNKSQLEILQAAEFASPGRDIAESVISMAVSRIRAEISAGQINSIDPDHSRIPPELKECALSLALEALQARLPDMPMPPQFQSARIWRAKHSQELRKANCPCRNRFTA